MSAPIIANVFRGNLLESIHHGHVAVVDSTGKLIASFGNPHMATFARSSVKLIQAIPVVESGAADYFHLTDEEIALICASHNAEIAHTDKVTEILQKIGVAETYLQCGPHMPYHAKTAEAMAEAGEKPRSIHNNCSGKHSGMLTLSKFIQAPLETYAELDHPVQQMNLKVMAEMSNYPKEQIEIGIDGCSVPVFGLPIFNLALAFARLVKPEVLGNEQREQACRRIVKSVQRHPFYLAGSTRFDTALIEATNGRMVCKAGAEAVFAVGIPEKGWGLVAKIEDGNSRAVYPAVVEALKQLGVLTEDELQKLESFHQPIVKNWRGDVVGRIQPTVQLELLS